MKWGTLLIFNEKVNKIRNHDEKFEGNSYIVQPFIIIKFQITFGYFQNDNL